MTDYLALPTVERPKYILPIASPFIFFRALELYTPYLLHRHLAIKFLKCLSSMHLLRYCAPKKIINSSNLSEVIHFVDDITAVIKDELKAKDTVCAFFKSRQGKYVIQIMNDKAKILGYAKVSIKGISKEDYQNEHNTLLKLSKRQFNNFYVPRVGSYVDTSDYCILILYPPEQKAFSCGLFINRLHIDTLVELFKCENRTTTLNQSSCINCMVKTISLLPDDSRKNVYLDAIKKVNANIGDIPISLGFCHYDFKPWNIKILQDGKLFIYDWEMAREQWLPLWDYFHFVLQTFILIKNKSPDFLLKALLKPSPELKIYAQSFNISNKTYLYLLFLYIVDVSFYYFANGRINEDIKASSYVNTLYNLLVRLLECAKL